MISQFEALWELHLFFTKLQIPYATIGGLAVVRWGEPRLTRDADVTALIPPGEEEKAARLLLDQFKTRLSDPIEFAAKNRVMALVASNGCEIDVSFGLPGYEQAMIAKAVDYELGSGKIVKMAGAEDLIIHKAVAGRVQDCLDIEGVVLRQGEKLDVQYIRKWLKEFSQVLESEEVLNRFEAPWTSYLNKKSGPGS